MTDCKNCKYTDEYCASGDCTSQSPRNDLAITSQVSDLTEQWRKGELEKCKDYYVKYGDYKMSLTLDGDNDFIFYGRPIKPKVLAPVPTFDEWQASYNCMLENEVLRLKNAQLKEMLKEIRGKIKTVYDMDLNQFITSAAFTDDFVKKIDEVLQCGNIK